MRGLLRRGQHPSPEYLPKSLASFLGGLIPDTSWQLGLEWLLVSPAGAAREDQCRGELLEGGSPVLLLLLPMGSKMWQREKRGRRMPGDAGHE